MEFKVSKRKNLVEIHLYHDLDHAWLINTVTIQIVQESPLHQESEAITHVSPLPKSKLNPFEIAQLQKYLGTMNQLVVKLNAFVDIKNYENIQEYLSTCFLPIKKTVFH